jgi:SpoVK/Ycf46/Vps4 family AAA+-type ATPase
MGSRRCVGISHSCVAPIVMHCVMWCDVIDKRVVVLGATSSAADLDQALRSRFDREISIGRFQQSHTLSCLISHAHSVPVPPLPRFFSSSSFTFAFSFSLSHILTLSHSHPFSRSQSLPSPSLPVSGVPDAKGRHEILSVLLRDVTLAPDCDVKTIARRAAG